MMFVNLAIISFFFQESEKDSSIETEKTSISPVKISTDDVIDKQNWSPRGKIDSWFSFI